MAGNSFGQLFRLTSFGESHGTAIGGVIDGCPAGLKLDVEQIRFEMSRRKPGQSAVTTSRKETDEVEILSGVHNGITLGTPIGFQIRNEDYKPFDYDQVENVYRPSHADYTYQAKYGIRDARGGGRSSARETAARVFAGSIAKQILSSQFPVRITAYVSQVGEIKLDKNYSDFDFSKIESNIVRCPDEKAAEKMIGEIESAKKDGDTLGGVITCVIQNTPAGLGEPVFDKLQAELAKAMLSVNAVHGFEYGSGFEGAKMKGSEHNDLFEERGEVGNVKTKTNNSGGIQGGISNGMDIYFRVAFKPVSTVMKDQTTIDKEGKEVILKAKGRHDPCVVPRAVPIVEAMAALVLADLYLRNRNSSLIV